MQYTSIQTDPYPARASGESLYLTESGTAIYGKFLSNKGYMGALSDLLELIGGAVLNLLLFIHEKNFRFKRWLIVRKMHRDWRKINKRCRMKYLIKFSALLKSELDRRDKSGLSEEDRAKKDIDEYTRRLDFESLLIFYCKLFPSESESIRKYFRFSRNQVNYDVGENQK